MKTITNTVLSPKLNGFSISYCTDLRSRFGKCLSHEENITDHNKNYGNPSYRYYRQWFTDYKGPEPGGLCIDLKKKESSHGQ